MNLKEAFRYQNFLDTVITELTHMLGYKANVMKVTQEHLISKANPEAQDETIDATAERKFDVPVDTLIDICNLLIHEKYIIGVEIAEAKNEYMKEHGFCIDAELAVNKHRQGLALACKLMGNMNDSERVTTGTAFKFNNEGNQVPYAYSIKETTTADFTRSKAKSVSRSLYDTADSASTKADICMVEAEVRFYPAFNFNDSVADVIEKGAKRLEALGSQV